MSAISVKGLTKRFGDICAIDHLSFEVPEGKVYGFLGQNGAGKSTTIRMLLTLIRPEEGTIEIFNKDLKDFRKEILKQIGAIIEKPDFYTYLTALENLKMMAELSGVKRSEKELLRQLEITGISERAHSKVKTFSQGMRQRLGIACALIHNPALIILDEPTNGLDPQGIADIRNLILQLCHEQQKTIFVSSHLLSEIEVTADYMLIIDKGKKIVEGKVEELLNPENTLVELETGDDKRTDKLILESQWSLFRQNENRIVLKMHKKLIPELVRFLTDNNVAILGITPKHSLEDFFLSLTTSNQHVETYKD